MTGHLIPMEEFISMDWYTERQKKQYTGGRIAPGLNMNTPACGFGFCEICDQPIRTSDTIVLNDRIQMCHAVCLYQQNITSRGTNP